MSCFISTSAHMRSRSRLKIAKALQRALNNFLHRPRACLKILQCFYNYLSIPFNYDLPCTTQAFASSAFSGSSTRLPISNPSSFLMTTPTPQLPDSLNTAPSTFILYQPHLGGDQWDFGGLEGSFKQIFSCRNSVTYSATSFEIQPASLRIPSCLSAFLWFQRLQAMAAKVSQSMPGFLPLISHTKSRNSCGWLGIGGSLSLEAP